MSGRFFGGSFQWKAWAHLQKIFDWTDRALRNDQKSWIFLVAFLYFYFRIIPSKIANHEVFLPIEELSVARFCKSRALSTRKYMVEQGIRVSHWSEIFKSIWLHSIFGLGQSKPSVSDKFGMVILFELHMFFTWVQKLHSKQPPKVLLEVKNLKNLHFWTYFLEVETVECFQNNLNVSDKFGTFMPCSASYFLEVSACL